MSATEAATASVHPRVYARSGQNVHAGRRNADEEGRQGVREVLPFCRILDGQNRSVYRIRSTGAPPEWRTYVSRSDHHQLSQG